MNNLRGKRSEIILMEDLPITYTKLGRQVFYLYKPSPPMSPEALEEVKKCRNDIVYFASNILGIELKPHQELLLKMTEKKNNFINMGMNLGRNNIYGK